MGDKVFCCIATGPSLVAADCDEIKARRLQITTIAINDSYRIAPWAEHLYACDGNWWAVHREQVFQDFRGEKWTQDPGFRDNPAFNFIKSIAGVGLSDEALVRGNNSGYQAINLAYILGAKKLLLLGYDMKGRGEHWFGRHDREKGLSDSTDYGSFISHFERMHPENYGLKLINCSRDTALECFPRMSLQDAFVSAGV